MRDVLPSFEEFNILSTTLYSLGKAVGSVVHWNFALVLIPLPRKSVILWATGISFESMVIFHKWLGRAVRVVVLI